ncbi:MAG: tRNA (guanosine(46)-N7)-methyltransferase TrmB [Saprospiraceae bacterium]
MSGRTKLEKFAANLDFPNVFENYDYEKPQLFVGHKQPINYKSNWKKIFFKNEFPLVLELACGRGEYSLGLAQINPELNIIGIDIKGARIWKGASNSLLNDLQRVAFVRSKIEVIDHFFGPEEIDEIWITFPDPFPRPTKSNKRLISNFYLDIYSKILRNGALINFKTDDPELFDFGLKTIQGREDFKLLYQNKDIYSKPLFMEALEIKTYYEKMHLQKGRTIKFLQAIYNKKS